ncbi:MAG: SDR family NAD(P)-dependent oxidoreductase [Acidobacteria bacterium]|nr:SDR family NAD(P)-dependent oxidoreductase [Acidobacteriota bacterium]
MTIKRAAWNAGKTAATYGARYAVRRAKQSTALKAAALTAGLAAGVTVGVAAYIHSSRRRSMRGKVVVITGGSRGLGLEIARQFGLAGSHLVLAARDEEELQRARVMLANEKAAHNGESVETVVADVSTPEGAQKVIDAAHDRYGRIDVLVNNAGVMHVAPFVDQPTEAFEEAMRTNFFSALYMTQAVVEEMRQRGEGHIVNIASIGGKIAVPHMLPYVASKFAFVGFSEGLHAELAPDGVHVLTVCPGLMRTGSFVQAKFGGRRQEEYTWFGLSSATPGLSISARAAARKIFRSTVAGCAEITITPQAWVAARIVGVAPGKAACLAGMANKAILPKEGGISEPVRGAELRQPTNTAAKAWSTHLQTQHNQIAS